MIPVSGVAYTVRRLSLFSFGQLYGKLKKEDSRMWILLFAFYTIEY
ncbi:MAG: hypothetical protein BMS9Abin05_2435 [Rhodothermia bacterium]|nr:MAG: hypothetical protein BMS9Abin05_2435 [Rhodothermia bacterium]